ncbi:MAG: hypothetical protein V3U57_08100 [Robiginitomaculum sp.]
MFSKVFTSVFAVSLFLSGGAFALTGEQVVEHEVIVKNADGTQTVKRVRADMVTPGDTVVYSLNYFNEKNETADNVVLVMPIPAEVSYLEGTADVEGARTAYSADGGKTFAARTALNVIDVNGKSRPARAQDITHIRWMIGTPIAPKASGTLSYSARLK